MADICHLDPLNPADSLKISALWDEWQQLLGNKFSNEEDLNELKIADEVCQLQRKYPGIGSGPQCKLSSRRQNIGILGLGGMAMLAGKIFGSSLATRFIRARPEGC